MARIADSSLEDIRQKVDIVELVREFVPGLKPAGRNHKACCPFHQEKTPSFMVNPEKQIFHCFGCQAGGDAFGFLMKMENLTFPEAVAKLAERAGVRLAEQDRTLGPQEKERLRLRNALEFARDHYHDLLMRSVEAGPARAYLKKRGLDRAAVERFRLGYAPKGGGLLAEAARKGFDCELLAKVGLAARREKGGHRDYFWGRILFPILNPRGEVAGFGARAMEDVQPKYLNSPDSPLFSKGRVLYGLFEGLSSVRKGRKALLLEGYMDVIAAHQFGFEHACAPLGTALTEDHAVLLKRYVDDAVIVFDPDAAGFSAALRGAEILLEKGLSVRIATVPEGLDPDELLHKGGAKALAACLDAATDLVEFQTGMLLKGRRAESLSPDEKSRAAARVLETIRKSPDEVLKRECLRRLAQRLDLDEESLHAQLGEAGAPRVRPVASRTKEGPVGKAPPADERNILWCLLRSPSLTAEEGLVLEEDFSHEGARRVFSALKAIPEGSSARGDRTTRLLEALSPEDAALARELLCDGRELKNPAALAAELVGRLRRSRRLRELKPLYLKMLEGSAPMDPEVHAEYKRLLSELRGTRKTEQGE